MTGSWEKNRRNKKTSFSLSGRQSKRLETTDFPNTKSPPTLQSVRSFTESKKAGGNKPKRRRERVYLKKQALHAIKRTRGNSKERPTFPPPLLYIVFGGHSLFLSGVSGKINPRRTASNFCASILLLPDMPRENSDSNSQAV